MNPFTDETVNRELEFLGPLEEGEYEGVKVRNRTLRGRCDDYLSVDYKTGDLTVPVLTFDDTIWMSMTPMEIQSNFMGWYNAGGHVAIGGLGLGYVALRAASNEDVETVIVYELEQRVINWFYKTYKGRPELEKIAVVHGDVRQELDYSTSFDFIYMDIYPTLLPDDVIKDYKQFYTLSEEYRFWGQERAIVSMLTHGIISSEDIPWSDRAFLSHWVSTQKHKAPINAIDYEFCQELAEVMNLV